MDLRFKLTLPKHLMRGDITDQLFLGAINDSTPHFGLDGLDRFKPSRDYEVERKQFQRLLRCYVDQWIDTGIFEDGTEDLSERGRLHDRWFRQGRLQRYAKEKRNSLDAVYTLVCEFFRQNPQVTLSEEGLQITFSTHEPKFSDAPLIGLAEREAKRFFVWFLASDLRMKLGKCRKCSRYEIKTRKFYTRGTYCRRCKAMASAEEITRQKRQDIQRKREEALNIVLKSFKGTINWNDLTIRKRLTADMNRRLKNEEKITSKWIKRNPSKH